MGKLNALVAGLVVQLVISPSMDASAQPTPDSSLDNAKTLYRHAERKFSVGEFEGALELYKQAFAQKDLPGFLFNIGQCHFNLGRYEKALFFYDRYLTRRPDAPNREIVEQLIERSKSALEKQRAAELQAAQAAASRPAPATQPANPDKAANPATDGGQHEAPPAETGSARQVILWSGVGLAAALAISGAVTGALVLDRRSQYLDEQTPLARQLELADSGQTLRTTTNVLFGVAGAVAIATGLYYWLGRGERKKAALSVAPTPAGGMVRLGGQF